MTTIDSTSFIVKGGTVIDRSGERRADVRIENGTITEVGPSLTGDDTLDASGCVVAPGFVDLHTHLREPGREDAETIETGSRAAALGGFTAVVAMPNTDPPHDSLAVVEQVRRAGVAAGLCEVAPSGCITIGRAGEQLAPMAELAGAEGIVVFISPNCGEAALPDTARRECVTEPYPSQDVNLWTTCG